MSASHAHLLPSHQEEVHGGHVDTDVAAELLQDVPDRGAGPQCHLAAGAVRERDAAVPGRALPHADRVAVVRLEDAGSSNTPSACWAFWCSVRATHEPITALAVLYYIFTPPTFALL